MDLRPDMRFSELANEIMQALSERGTDRCAFDIVGRMGEVPIRLTFSVKLERVQ